MLLTSVHSVEVAGHSYIGHTYIGHNFIQVKSLLNALDHFYQHHYVSSAEPASVHKKKMYNLVRKRDRASIVAWLARAPAEQRDVFRGMMESMKRTKEGWVDRIIYEVSGARWG